MTERERIRFRKRGKDTEGTIHTELETELETETDETEKKRLCCWTTSYYSPSVITSTVINSTNNTYAYELKDVFYLSVLCFRGSVKVLPLYTLYTAYILHCIHYTLQTL